MKTYIINLDYIAHRAYRIDAKSKKAALAEAKRRCIENEYYSHRAAEGDFDQSLEDWMEEWLKQWEFSEEEIYEEL